MINIEHKATIRVDSGDFIGIKTFKMLSKDDKQGIKLRIIEDKLT